MDVSVVIICWNGRKLLQTNLPLVIKAAKNPINKIGEILVVDDGSTDDSPGFLKENYPEVKLVIHDKNLGYSAACNTGVKEAKGELVVILNLDVAPSSNFLGVALLHFDNEKVFAVSFNEGKFGPGKLAWKKGFLEIVPIKIPSETFPTDWPSGGTSIFRKKIWQELRGMDEIFLPFYFEDIDLGIRAKKSGFICLWEPKSCVVHEHEATINYQNFDKNYLDSVKERNHLLLTWRNIKDVRQFFSHFFYLLKRCILHPKYQKIVFLALKRRCQKNFFCFSF